MSEIKVDTCMQKGLHNFQGEPSIHIESKGEGERDINYIYYVPRKSITTILFSKDHDEQTGKESLIMVFQKKGAMSKYLVLSK